MLIVAFLIVGLLIFLSLFKLIKERSSILSIGFIFVVEIIWLFLSIIYIDFGKTYISEQGRISHFTGASIRLLLIYLPFLLVISNFCRSSDVHLNDTASYKIVFLKIKKETIYMMAQVVLLCVVTYGCIDMLLTGVPLFSDYITRSNFFSHSKLPGASLIMGEVTFFLMFLNGKYFFESKQTVTKVLCVFLLLFSLVHRILMSYKYDGLYQIVFMFFLFGFYNWLKDADIKKIISLKTVMIGLGIIIVVLAFAYFSYRITNKNQDPLKLLFSRLFSLQAHTWWGEDLCHLNNSDFGFNWNQLKKELKILFNGGDVFDKETGLVKVMYDIVHPSVVNTYTSQGLRFYGNWATVAINSFGYIGTAIWGIVLAKIIAFSIAHFERAIRNSEYVLMFVSLSLLLDVIEYFRIGNFSLIFNIKTLIMYFIIIMGDIVKETYRNKQARLLL